MPTFGPVEFRTSLHLQAELCLFCVALPCLVFLCLVFIVNKKKYLNACEEQQGLFTPICCSADGMFANEAKVFLSRVAERLTIKWERTYGEVMGWMSTRMSFAILRLSILCLRGSRTKWRCLGLEDGMPISLINN